MSTTHAILEDLALATGVLDRSGHERRDPRLLDALLTDPATRVVEIRGEKAAVDVADGRGSLRLRAPQSGDRTVLAAALGRGPDGRAYVAVLPLTTSEELDGSWLTLRRAGDLLDRLDAGLFTTALALANWHGTHGRCSLCGSRTEPIEAGWVRHCPKDGSEHYPRTDPAVIMSVIDPDDRILLGRSPRWPEGRFSVLAGFVEPGESFEQAVAREVAEEVGIAVDDVTYLGNQPWPFPSSVMVGFAARTAQVDLTLDPVEMAEARWMTRDEYRQLLRSHEIRTPVGISIAKRMIEHWLGESVESAARG
ncbi:MAG: NAD(+) diphosphatase [Intrasporangium sp.]|uniref:NAD(+) diphosphatase n=1 Tax=Intrasporangium sp. TaxID=1925024 RepID=UPI0026494A8A|nr:NAD(+) diphosphatase [Intrasporangium sp.]MDN5797241.1 NAD(+) diphosphatase [Intrasporangium sp.]